MSDQSIPQSFPNNFTALRFNLSCKTSKTIGEIQDAVCKIIPKENLKGLQSYGSGVVEILVDGAKEVNLLLIRGVMFENINHILHIVNEKQEWIRIKGLPLCCSNEVIKNALKEYGTVNHIIHETYGDLKNLRNGSRRILIDPSGKEIPHTMEIEGTLCTFVGHIVSKPCEVCNTQGCDKISASNNNNISTNDPKHNNNSGYNACIRFSTTPNLNVTIADVYTAVCAKISSNAILGCQKLSPGSFEVLINDKQATEKILLDGIAINNTYFPVHIYRDLRRWIWITGLPLNSQCQSLERVLSPYGKLHFIGHEVYNTSPRIFSGIRRVLLELNGKEIPREMKIEGVTCTLTGSNIQRSCYVCGSFMCYHPDAKVLKKKMANLSAGIMSKKRPQQVLIKKTPLFKKPKMG